jgi:hypothetical protein
MGLLSRAEVLLKCYKRPQITKKQIYLQFTPRIAQIISFLITGRKVPNVNI